MKQIETEKWSSIPENPGTLNYEGQRSAQEIFAELRERLEGVGMLPDEYFLLDDCWENGREIPKGAEIFSTVKYGESEGIYLDIGIRWYEDSKPHMTTFATGKTLGETDSHLDRMYLTASAVNKAFYSSESHARYIKTGPPEKMDTTIIHLSEAERRLMIDSLVERRSNLVTETTATEQLLRRVTGSITEFINEVGAKPLQIDNFDLAIIAIDDGNLAALDKIFREVPSEKEGLLLAHAAGRAGKVGYEMTSLLLKDSLYFTNEDYLTACKNAVATGDAEKVFLLIDYADECVHDLESGFYGRIISEAISGHQGKMVMALVNHCTPEQIQAANPYVLAQGLYARYDFRFASSMAEKGIDVTFEASQVIRALKYYQNDWMLKHLLDKGMKLDSRNLSALKTCIEIDSAEMGKVLIDHGMNFGLYERWSANQTDVDNSGDTFTALKQYWEDKIEREQPPPAKTEKPGIAERLAEGKAKADAHNAARPASETRRTAQATEH